MNKLTEAIDIAYRNTSVLINTKRCCKFLIAGENKIEVSLTFIVNRVSISGGILALGSDEFVIEGIVGLVYGYNAVLCVGIGIINIIDIYNRDGIIAHGIGIIDIYDGDGILANSIGIIDIIDIYNGDRIIAHLRISLLCWHKPPSGHIIVTASINVDVKIEDTKGKIDPWDLSCRGIHPSAVALVNRDG